MNEEQIRQIVREELEAYDKNKAANQVTALVQAMVQMYAEQQFVKLNHEVTLRVSKDDIAQKIERLLHEQINDRPAGLF